MISIIAGFYRGRRGGVDIDRAERFGGKVRGKRHS